MGNRIKFLAVAVLLVLSSCSIQFKSGMFIFHNPEEDFRNPAISYVKSFKHKGKVRKVSFLKEGAEIHEGNGTYCEHITKEGATLNVQTFSVGGENQYEINIICDDFGKIEANDFTSLFSGYTMLKDVDFGDLPIDKVTSMKDMYLNCSSLETVPAFKDLDGSDANGYNPTIEVMTMEGMFRGCVSLHEATSGISGWNTQKVQSYKNMFAGCENIRYVSVEHLETSSLQDAEGMFDGCERLEKIFAADMTDWSDIIGIRKSDNMFRGCENLEGFDPDATDKRKAKVDGGYFTAV